MASLTQWTWVGANSGKIVKNREAWHTAVHRVTKSQTQLSSWTTTAKASISLALCMLGRWVDPWGSQGERDGSQPCCWKVSGAALQYVWDLHWQFLEGSQVYFWLKYIYIYSAVWYETRTWFHSGPGWWALPSFLPATHFSQTHVLNSGEGSLLCLQMAVFSLDPPWQRQRKTLWGPFYKGTNPIHEGSILMT